MLLLVGSWVEMGMVQTQLSKLRGFSTLKH